MSIGTEPGYYCGWQKKIKNSDFVQKAIATEVVSEFLNRSKTDLQGNDPSTELAEALDKLKSDLNQIK